MLVTMVVTSNKLRAKISGLGVSMADPRFTVGDEIGIEVTLYRSGTLIAIDPTSTVRAAVSNSRRTKSYTGPVSQDLTSPDHDLPNGKLWIVIPNTSTSKLIIGRGILEVEVYDPTNRSGEQEDTWTQKVNIDGTTLS